MVYIDLECTLAFAKGSNKNHIPRYLGTSTTIRFYRIYRGEDWVCTGDETVGGRR